MQLGTRWQRGDTPPAQVPESLRASIREHEAEHPQAAAWTLTWLEGRPRLQLTSDETLTLGASGQPVWERSSEEDYDDDDDWLL